MSYQEVHHGIDFALTSLGGVSNQGDAANALRGCKVVLSRMEAASQAPAAPVVPVDEATAALIAAAKEPVPEVPQPAPAVAPAANSASPPETLAQKIEHAVEGALGVAEAATLTQRP